MNTFLRIVHTISIVFLITGITVCQEDPVLDSLLKESRDNYTLDPIKSYEIALEARDLSSNSFYYAKATSQMARALVGTTRKAECPVLVEEAVAIAKENDFLKIEIEALNALGLYYYLKGFFSTATTTYHNALVLSEKYGDDFLIIQQINQMAIAQIEAGDYDQAEAHLLTMRGIAQRINAERPLRLSYANMAYSLINQKRYQEALPELEKYNELNKNTTELTSKVIEENMLSQVFFGIKDYTKAQYHIDQALLIADSIGYIDGKILTLKTLTELQFTTKEYDAAIATANRIIEHNETTGSDRFTIDALSYLSQSHEIKGNYKQALKYQQELLDQKETTFSRDKQNISERLEIEYDIRTKEREREELLRNKERNETIIRQRTLLALGTLAAAFLLAVAIYLQYMNLVQRKKNNEQLEYAVAERTKELEHINSRLIQSNKELERFAFVASHDLKEPIRNLVSFSTLLSRQIEQQETPSKEYIDIIRKNAKNVFTLVDGILNFSRIRKVNFSLFNIEFASIIEEVKDLIDTTLRQSNAVVLHNVEGQICVDRAQFTLVLKNIIENGIKYNKSTEPVIEIWKESDAEYDHISIKDNGIGLDAKYRDEIFDMFKRLHNKNEYEGSGLGLSICHKIIQEHQGSIRVESELGEGSTFIISIPRKQCEANENQS